MQIQADKNILKKQGGGNASAGTDPHGDVLWHLDWRRNTGSPANGDRPVPENSMDVSKVETEDADEELHVRTENGTLYAAGDIDLYQAGAFRDAAEPFITETPSPRLDLTGVPFLDSAGLAVLLVLARQATAQNKSLRVLVQGSPRRVLKITGIDRVLTLED